ncbi:MAG: hypothetical protein ACRD3O_00895 [Terriglobia bacterium]
MKPLFILCLAASLLLSAGAASAVQKGPETYAIPLPPQPDYSGLKWLVGQWSGKRVGEAGQGEVLLSVSYALGKRFMMLREEVSLPAVAGAPEIREGLLGIVSAGASAKVYNLALYSSNGFVMNYQVTAGAGEIDFNPAGGSLSPAGWLFRRVIRHTAPGQCTETVDAAPPGKGFFRFYTARLSQVLPGSKARPASAAKPAKGHGIFFWRKLHRTSNAGGGS